MEGVRNLSVIFIDCGRRRVLAVGYRKIAESADKWPCARFQWFERIWCAGPMWCDVMNRWEQCTVLTNNSDSHTTRLHVHDTLYFKIVFVISNRCNVWIHVIVIWWFAADELSTSYLQSSLSWRQNLYDTKTCLIAHGGWSVMMTWTNKYDSYQKPYGQKTESWTNDNSLYYIVLFSRIFKYKKILS